MTFMFSSYRSHDDGDDTVTGDSCDRRRGDRRRFLKLKT